MKRVSISKMRQTHLNKAEEAFYLNEGFVLTRRGKPIAALISIREFSEKFSELEETAGRATS